MYFLQEIRVYFLYGEVVTLVDRRKFDFLYTNVFFPLGIGDIYVLLSGPLSNLSSRKDFIISAQATYSTRKSDSYISLVASYRLDY